MTNTSNTQNTMSKIRAFASNVVERVKKPAVAVVGLGVSAMAHAQATDPVTTVTGASTTSQTAWAAFAAISASAFVFAMVIRFGRKGTK